jgi:hypothetical protein
MVYVGVVGPTRFDVHTDWATVGARGTTTAPDAAAAATPERIAIPAHAPSSVTSVAAARRHRERAGMCATLPFEASPGATR